MPVPRKELFTNSIKSSDVWYFIGLLTSDGCLSSDKRHINITSSDYRFLEEIKKLIGIKNKIGIKYGGTKKKAFQIQLANRIFYDFLLSIGLTPRKSLTLKKVKVPDMYFFDFLRG